MNSSYQISRESRPGHVITLETGNCRLRSSKEGQQSLLPVFSTMSLNKNCGSFVLFLLSFYSPAFTDGINVTASEPADKPSGLSPSHAAPAAASELGSAVRPRLDSLLSLALSSSSFPDDMEISDYCVELLHVFGQRYVAYVNCLVPAARPVKMCQSCFSSYGSLVDIYGNISEKVQCELDTV